MIKKSQRKTSIAIGLVASLSVVTATPAWAEQSTNTGTVNMGQTQAPPPPVAPVTPATSTTAAPEITISNNGEVTSPTSRYAAPVTGQGAASTAKSAQSGQMMGVAVSVAAAGVLTYMCKKPGSTSTWACPMAVMAGLQAAMTLTAAKQSGGSAGSLSTYTPAQYDTTYDTNGNPITINRGNTGVTGSNENTAEADRGSLAITQQLNSLGQELETVNRDLAAAGVVLSPDGKTVTMPDGKKVETASFSSPDAMIKSGMTEGQIAELNSTLAAAAVKAQDKIRGLSMAVEGGAGGAGPMGAPSGGGGGGGSANYRFGESGRNTASAKVAEPRLSRRVGDSNVGLPGDNIWDMAHDRYKELDGKGTFKKD